VNFSKIGVALKTLLVLLFLSLISGCATNPKAPEQFKPGEVAPTPPGCVENVDC